MGDYGMFRSHCPDLAGAGRYAVLADLAEAVGGYLLNESGALVALPDEPNRIDRYRLDRFRRTCQPCGGTGFLARFSLLEFLKRAA
jgi:hypothetical protein